MKFSNSKCGFFLAFLSFFAFISSAQATTQDVSTTISSIKCEIPSDDQKGVAELFINEKSGHRSLVFALEYAEFAKWKMITVPVDTIASDDQDGSLAMTVQYKNGYEGSIQIKKDGAGAVNLKNPAGSQDFVLSNCQIQF